jgi:S-adenosylmethionine synthetase
MGETVVNGFNCDHFYKIFIRPKEG